MTTNDLDRILKATGLGDYRDPPWDKVLWGDGDRPIRGAAVCWSSTLDQLRKGQDLGCNLFVTHEPLYAYTDVTEFPHPSEAAKRDFLAAGRLTVYRCHDVWDIMPGIGIADSWASFLGFHGEPARTRRFLRAYDLPAGATLGGVARDVLSRVTELGQSALGVIGRDDQSVRRIATGTGAITPFREMASLGADLLVLTDDGIRTWELAQWARDTGVAVILVNHATAEEPGIRNLARWLADRLDVPVHHLPCGCLYRALASPGSPTAD